MVATAALVLAINGCSTPGTHGEDSQAGERAAYDAPVTAELISPARAKIELTRLRRIPRQRAAVPYLRDAFGSAWADVDGNGCNQRDDVLLRDSTPDTTRTAPQGACDHDVLAGTWVDP